MCLKPLRFHLNTQVLQKKMSDVLFLGPAIARVLLYHQKRVIIRGVPQVIHSLSLEASNGIAGLNMSELLNHVLIGPTVFPIAVKEAFETLLREKGFSDVQGKMRISEIPLRV